MHFFEIIPILYYSVYLVIALYAIGYGLTSLTLPLSLKKHAFILTPWFTLVAITFLFTVASLAGVSVRLATWVTLPPLLLMTGIVLHRQTISFAAIDWQKVVLGMFVGASILLHLMPLLRRDRMLTTISLGNNDVIVYANTPDYLVDHSIFEGYKYLPSDLKPTEKGVANLLHDGFRWGAPILAAFLQVITGLEGWQMAYLHVVVLYSLLIPLAYLLFQLIYKRSWVGLLVIGMGFLLNANMLYMLYHVFAGQVVFWGLFLLLLIYFVTYFSEEKKTHSFTYFEILIGVTITTLYFSYHEGILFVVGPAVLFGVFSIYNRRLVATVLMWSRIGFVVLLTGAPAVVNATIFDFFQASLIDAPIGWERFRAVTPFANLFEMAGMHSIHTEAPQHRLLALPASLITGIVFAIGYIRSRMKVLMICYIVLFITLLVWSSVLHSNFFIYNRIVTYLLPLLLTIFAVGVDFVFHQRKITGVALLVLFITLNCYSGFALVKKFMNNHLSVDRSLISLQSLNDEATIREPIYLDQVVLSDMYYWRMIWMEYFLYPNKQVVSLGNLDENTQIEDGDLLLVQSSHFAYPSPKVVLDPVVWENGYFRVGHVCITDACIGGKSIPLSEVIVGTSAFEDTMLLEGWSVNEGEHRWAKEKRATARFVVSADGAQTISLEARSLQSPQTVIIKIDGTQVGAVELKAEWDVYTLDFSPTLPQGVHHVEFLFERAYKPSEVLGNTDMRELYGDFRRISLQ